MRIFTEYEIRAIDAYIMKNNNMWDDTENQVKLRSLLYKITSYASEIKNYGHKVDFLLYRNPKLPNEDLYLFAEFEVFENKKYYYLIDNFSALIHLMEILRVSLNDKDFDSFRTFKDEKVKTTVEAGGLKQYFNPESETPYFV